MDYLFYQNPRYIESMDSNDLYELTLDFQVPLVTTVTFKNIFKKYRFFFVMYSSTKKNKFTYFLWNNYQMIEIQM